MPYVAGPYSSSHYYLQWGGKLPGLEQWSCGIRLYNNAGGTPTYDAAMHTACKNAVQAFHINNSSGIGSNAKLSFVKLNVIGQDGKYAEQVTHEQVLADVPGGGSSAQLFPNQIANVVSLTTGFSRGPAHRGRFYLPLPVFAIDAAGVYAAANAQALSGTVDTLVAALNATVGGAKVAVFSRKLGSPAHRLVTGNLVGRVYDTQRRRRRSLVEDYQ